MKSSDRPIEGFTGERHNTLARVPALPEALGELVRRDRLSHAVCLEGESPARRRDCALALAGAILCREGRGRMCGECSACRKVMAGAHADVIVCDPAREKDIYKKENLRALRASAFRLPVEGRAKIFLLMEAQLIPAEGQNLLLKVIEEPPENTVFLLGCPNRCLLLPTILSRVTVFALPALDDAACMEELQLLAPGHTDEEYARALIRCGGSPETGAALLEEPAVQRCSAAAEEMTAGLATGSGYRVLAAAAPFEKDRAQYTALLSELGRLLANEDIRRIYNLSALSAARFRGCLAPLSELCERNAHLPLVSALLVRRCLRP